VLRPFTYAIGTFIGIGVLILPTLFQQAGLLVATATLCLAALLLGLLTFVVTDLIKITDSNLPKAVETFTERGKPLVRIFLAIFTYGALTAYVLGAGSQMSVFLGGGARYWGALFFMLAALPVIQGHHFSTSVSLYLSLALLLVLAFLIPLNTQAAAQVVPAAGDLATIPFLLSTAIFALFGHFSLYELHHMLKSDKDRYTVFFGAFFLCLLLYLAYALTSSSVGPMGPLSTVSLLFYHTGVPAIIVSLVAVLAFYTSFVTISSTFLKSLSKSIQTGGALAVLFFPPALLYLLIQRYNLMSLTQLVARFCGVGILLFSVLACLAHFRASRKYETTLPGWVSISLGLLFSAVAAFNIFPI
jgi:amino acid permease